MISTVFRWQVFWLLGFKHGNCLDRLRYLFHDGGRSALHGQFHNSFKAIGGLKWKSLNCVHTEVSCCAGMFYLYFYFFIYLFIYFFIYLFIIIYIKYIYLFIYFIFYLFTYFLKKMESACHQTIDFYSASHQRLFNPSRSIRPSIHPIKVARIIARLGPLPVLLRHVLQLDWL